MPDSVHDALPYFLIFLLAIACYLLTRVVSVLKDARWTIAHLSEQLVDLRDFLKVLENFPAYAQPDEQANRDLHALAAHFVRKRLGTPS